MTSKNFNEGVIRISDRLKSMPSVYGQGLDVRAYEAVKAFLAEILHTDEDVIKLERELDRVGNNAFMSVPPPRPSTEFELAFYDAWSFFRNKNAVHLEIGVSVAWPEERLRAARESERLSDIIRLDFDASCPIDVAASVTALPFADNSIDRIQAISLIEHVAYPHEVIAECFRVLKPGGLVYFNVPFLFVRHGYPDDYLRYTDSFFREVLGDAGFVDTNVDTAGTRGVFLTIANLVKAARAQDDQGTASQVHQALTALLAATAGLDDDMIEGAPDHWFATLAFARKPGPYGFNAPLDIRKPFIERHINRLACPLTLSPLKIVDGALENSSGYRWPVKNGIPELVQLRGAYKLVRTRDK